MQAICDGQCKICFFFKARKLELEHLEGEMDSQRQWWWWWVIQRQWRWQWQQQRQWMLNWKLEIWQVVCQSLLAVFVPDTAWVWADSRLDRTSQLIKSERRITNINTFAYDDDNVFNLHCSLIRITIKWFACDKRKHLICRNLSRQAQLLLLLLPRKQPVAFGKVSLGRLSAAQTLIEQLLKR